jgi:tetratricopeptide (TPR) repeat protein
MCYYKQGNIDEAIEDAMSLYNDGYRSITLYGMLGFFNILKAPMAQETFDFCKEAMDYADDDRDIMDNMLICYYNRGEYEKAKEISDRVLENQPKFVEAWYHGAQIDVKLGDYSAALLKLERIKDCNRSFMTTISEESVEALKAEAAEKAKERV